MNTYHIVIEANNLYPEVVGDYVKPFIGTELPSDFLLHSPDISDVKWCALTIEVPYEHEEGSSYTAVVEADEDELPEIIGEAVYQAKINLDRYPHGELIGHYEGRDLYKQLVEVKLPDGYDDYNVIFYTID